MTAKTPDTKANKAQTEREQRLKRQLKANLARRKAGPPRKSKGKSAGGEASE